MATWSHLPKDLLLHIASHLSVPDHHRFASVCSSWRSAASSSSSPPPPPPPRHQSPWLMFSAGPDQPSAANFFSLSETNIYRIPLPAPPIADRVWVGSAHGWLVTADAQSDLSLLNPITRQQIKLPPATGFDNVAAIRDSEGKISRYFVGPSSGERFPLQGCDAEKLRYILYMKAVLSNSPSCGDYTIMLIVYRPYLGLAFARSGDSKWTSIDTKMAYHDIVYHKDRFYTIASPGIVQVWDFSGVSPKPVTVVPEPAVLNGDNPYCKYLVSSPWGDLLQVWRSKKGKSWEDYKTCRISVFRVDFGRGKLFQVDSLEEHALFLGGNMSTCISSLDVPGVDKDCVYFTDECLEFSSARKHIECDVGVYNLRNRNVDWILYDDICLSWPPPIWFTPYLT